VSVCFIESMKYLSESPESQIGHLSKLGFYVGEGSLAATILSDDFFDDYVPYLRFETELSRTHPSLIALKNYMADEISPKKEHHRLDSLKMAATWQNVRSLAQAAITECEDKPLPGLD